ncbi:hypothetical protein [Paracoccus sediminicola]|uniref:hypothetical protein n=1 Tax=Paracoccus sediminicola TaxID=3017783 RepID=UPI0022F062CB|nr:hypothetical protein [Paracoccus sediminicola]WBU57174.1 hypothetical protein PAF18_01635 [Paracoccus sediminicola]
MAVLTRKIALTSLLASCAATAGAAPADPDIWAPRMAEAYQKMMGSESQPEDAAQIEEDMRRLISAYAVEPLLAEKAPPAFVQAATLAREGSEPATRGAMYDLARDTLTTAAALSGEPAGSFAPLAAWEEADPFEEELITGMGLASSDVAALGRMKALQDQDGLSVIPEGDPAALVHEAWDGEGQQVNLVFPTRLQAWADGVEAAWPELDASEREAALAVLFREEIPPAATMEKILGTDDVIHWLAAVDIPMTDAEREASPELIHFMEMGAFAGPLKEPLMEIAQLRAAQGSMSGMSSAANQLMRLNNWGAGSYEMHSWESYRYMTQGF